MGTTSASWTGEPAVAGLCLGHWGRDLASLGHVPSAWTPPSDGLRATAIRNKAIAIMVTPLIQGSYAQKDLSSSCSGRGRWLWLAAEGPRCARAEEHRSGRRPQVGYGMNWPGRTAPFRWATRTITSFGGGFYIGVVSSRKPKAVSHHHSQRPAWQSHRAISRGCRQGQPIGRAPPMWPRPLASASECYARPVASTLDTAGG